MPKNVEIKAKISDFNKILTAAKNLFGDNPQILHQEDIFFVTSRGRLKLRTFKDGSESQLIFYERADIEQPKISEYNICPIDNYQKLLKLLELALGIIRKVIKTRYLFLFKQTRIHLDKVEGLGDFLELEVVLSSNQSIKEGEDIAYFLMKKLEVNEKDLIKEAYVDLLEQLK